MAIEDEVIPPGSVIGILGGGQLGRMLVLAAARLGYRCRIFEPQADCPAGHVADHVAAEYTDVAALDAFARSVDVVTLEFENVPVEALDRLSRTVPVRPNSKALRVAQDRLAEKAFLNDAGIETAPWAAMESDSDVADAVAKIGLPAIAKTARFGYDGKGQLTVRPEDDPLQVWRGLGGVPAILEGVVPFTMEISVLAARAPDGRHTAYAPVENRHRNHILHKTLVPADIQANVAERARDIALKVVDALDYVGLLAVEMFVTAEGAVLVNEIAPRPHNSGHWTIDFAATSQFEQAVRAICNLPLGDTAALVDCEMENLIGAEADAWPAILAEPGARLHLYGKAESRPGRKMGHVNRPITRT